MEKVKVFHRDIVEACRNCRGEGYVAKPSTGKSYYGKETCPVCEGSGLIRKRIEGSVTVEPHRRQYNDP